MLRSLTGGSILVSRVQGAQFPRYSLAVCVSPHRGESVLIECEVALLEFAIKDELYSVFSWFLHIFPRDLVAPKAVISHLYSIVIPPAEDKYIFINLQKIEAYEQLVTRWAPHQYAYTKMSNEI